MAPHTNLEDEGKPIDHTQAYLAKQKKKKNRLCDEDANNISSEFSRLSLNQNQSPFRHSDTPQSSRSGTSSKASIQTKASLSKASFQAEMYAAYNDYAHHDKELANDDLVFIAADGECGPRSIAYILEGTNENWKDTKRFVLRYALNHRQHLNEQFGLLDDDIGDLLDDGVWQPEIFLKVASQAFGIHLSVYNYSFTEGEVAVYEPNCIHHEGKIFYWNGHFSPIVPQRCVHVVPPFHFVLKSKLKFFS